MTFRIKRYDENINRLPPPGANPTSDFLRHSSEVLNGCAKELQGLKDEQLKSAGLLAVSRLLTIVNSGARLLVEGYRLARAATPGLTAGANAAAAQLPPSTVDRKAAINEIATKIEATFNADLESTIAKRGAAGLNRAARDAVQFVGGFGDAIEKAKYQFRKREVQLARDPGAAPATLESLLVEQRSIRLAQGKGLDAAAEGLELLTQAVRFSDLDGQRKAEVVYAPICREILQQKHKPLKDWGGDSAAFEKARAAAAKFVALADAAREQRMPNEIRIAVQCFERLQFVIRDLVGYSPRWLSAGEFANAYLGTSESPKATDIAERWWCRFLPGREPMRFGEPEVGV